MYNNYTDNIIKRYSIVKEDIININEQISEIDKTLKLIEIIGKRRGAIALGGKIDETKTAKIILEDFRSGKIGKITLEKVKE